MAKKPEARIINKKRVYSGFLKVDECTIEADTHDGGKQTVTRLVIERGHAVAILGYDPVRDEVVLVNEMRPGPLAAGDYPYNDSLPAGMIDKGETPVDAACREMLEETGMALKDTFVIHPGAYTSSGGSTERLAFVFGIVSSAQAGGVHGKAAEGENINTVVIKADEFIRRAENFGLKDTKSLCAAFWFARNRDKIRAQYVPPSPPKVDLPSPPTV